MPNHIVLLGAATATVMGNAPSALLLIASIVVGLAAILASLLPLLNNVGKIVKKLEEIARGLRRVRDAWRGDTAEPKEVGAHQDKPNPDPSPISSPIPISIKKTKAVRGQDHCRRLVMLHESPRHVPPKRRSGQPSHFPQGTAA